MLISRILLKCEACEEVYRMYRGQPALTLATETSPEALRLEARELGWRNIEDFDLCPACAHASQFEEWLKKVGF